MKPQDQRPAPAPSVPVSPPDAPARFRGCLLAGAVGDMLGAPVEFLRWPEIRIAYGDQGIQAPASAYGRVGSIADSTQLTLFTAEGLIDAMRGAIPRSGRPPFEITVSLAYLRWLLTQGVPLPAGIEVARQGGLLEHRELFAQRTPSLTSLDALEQMQAPGRAATNSRRGNNAVARSAPVGLLYSAAADRDDSLRRECLLMGMRLAGLTHGHPGAQIAAGTYAVIVAQLAAGASLTDALPRASALLRDCPDSAQMLGLLEQAMTLADSLPASAAGLARLGEGWDADQALAIALYCVLSAPDPRSGLLLAVNQPGDSDACAAMVGQLYGCLYGPDFIPSDWLEVLELRAGIDAMAGELHSAAVAFTAAVRPAREAASV